MAKIQIICKLANWLISKLRLPHDFFASAMMSPFRGEQVQCFGAGVKRTAAEIHEFCIHPRLRCAHLGLLRCRLFEATMLWLPPQTHVRG